MEIITIMSVSKKFKIHTIIFDCYREKKQQYQIEKINNNKILDEKKSIDGICY